MQLDVPPGDENGTRSRLKGKAPLQRGVLAPDDFQSSKRVQTTRRSACSDAVSAASSPFLKALSADAIVAV